MEEPLLCILKSLFAMKKREVFCALRMYKMLFERVIACAVCAGSCLCQASSRSLSSAGN